MAVQSRRTAAVAVLATRRPVKAPDELKRASKPADPVDPAEPADPVAEFRAQAQVHALKALKVLASLMANASSEAVRVSAANSLIDRAHGRPAQALRMGARGEDDEGAELTIAWLSPEKS